jgi:GntR family transcriptional regulator
MVEIDKDNPLPLYYQLRLWLLDEIDQGRLNPGDQIPTEAELCQRFNLSRGTVRSALKELIDEGRIFLVRGRGTFVAELPQAEWSLATSVSFSEALERQGIRFGTRVLELCEQAAGPLVASRLQIEPGSPVVFLKRLRIIEDQPWILMISYLPQKKVPELPGLDLNDRSFYQVLEEQCGVSISAQERVMTVGLATEEEAALLQVPLQSPVQRFEDLAFAKDGNLVEFSYSIFRGDRSRFLVRLTRVQREAGV